MSAELGHDAERPSGAIELHAVVWGTISAACIVVPVAAIVGFLDRNDNDAGGIATILKVVLLVSALFAGFAGGRTASDRRAVNGALTGAVTFVLVQVVYAITRGAAPNVLGLVYLFFIGACLGTLGGLLAARWAKADEPRRPLDDDEENEDEDATPRRRSAFDPLPDTDVGPDTDTDNPGSTR